MKIGKWHLLFRKVRQITLQEISSYYFDMMRLNNDDADCQLMTKGFEDGYRHALNDLGIDDKDHPKGAGDKQLI